MVLSWYGIEASGRRLRVLLGTTQYGTAGPRLPLIEQFGVRVDYRRATGEDELFASLARGIPPICLVMTEALPYWQENVGHAVVVVAADADSVTVLDPAYATQPQRVPLNAFLIAWIGHDLMFALISPK